MMKERPIIFSTESVRAILDGRKTQTRRAVKPQPSGLIFHNQTIQWRSDGTWSKDDDSFGKGDGNFYLERLDLEGKPTEKYYRIGRCQFGVPGDRLWVREAFVCEGCPKCCAGIPALGGNCTCDEYVLYGDTVPVPAIYPPQKPRLTSPLFMPRKFSRLTLEITDVRCERLHDITEQDAISEGMLLYERWQSDDYKNDVITAKASGTKPPLGFSPKKRFAHLWDSLNLKRGFGWDTNCWVWVIEFKRVEK